MTSQDQLVRMLKRLDAKQTNQLERMLGLAEKYNIKPEELKERLPRGAQAEFDALVMEEVHNP